MKLVLGYSHVDAFAALRLLLWIEKLGGVSVPVVCVATRLASCRPAHQAIGELLRLRFAKSELHVLGDEDERGWPYSATHLFGRSLSLVDDDMFWLEPDCVPIKSGWFEDLLEEWDRAGTTFVGVLVKAASKAGVKWPDHMTGCGFYGRNWRSIVPKLGDGVSKPHGAWDVDFSKEMLTDFTHTELIHHRWKRDEPGFQVHKSDVRPGAVLFHQCKTGNLMSEIDPEFESAPLTVQMYSVTTSNKMPKFYLSQNAGKPVKVSGVVFNFEPCEYFAPTSSWWGVYGTEDDAEIEKLESLASKGYVSEISEAEFQEWLVKKKNPSSSHNLINLGVKFAPSMNGAPKPAVSVEPVAPKPAAESASEVLKPAQLRRGR